MNKLIFSFCLLAAACTCGATETERFFSAVKNGQRKIVKEMLRTNKALVWDTDARGRTPFLLAVQLKDLNMTYLLGQAFSRITSSCVYGNAFHIAAANRDEAMVQLIARLAAGESADTAKQMLNAPQIRSDQAALDDAGQVRLDTPLHIAARQCQYKIYNYFVRLGADPQAKNEQFQTPAQLLAHCPPPPKKPAAGKPRVRPAGK